MKYDIAYYCVSDIGKRRSVNQDNFICDGKFMELEGDTTDFPLSGTKSAKSRLLLGIFDGMGGEECGEVASYIASKTASQTDLKGDAIKKLLELCQKANLDICAYIDENGLYSMGTTAAMLAFDKKGISLCNVGDSKIFRFSKGKLEQISKDHVAFAPFGVKPPLSQNLGIPPAEMLIDPYVAKGNYNDGDIYLICSDGLTDMVSLEDISKVLEDQPFDDATEILLSKALENGGRDNVTIILCKIKKRSFWRFCRKKKD